MNTFLLKITTPDGACFNEDAEALFLRGSEGDLAILKNHAKFVTTVVPGEVRVELPDGSDKIGTTDGGILTVSENEVTLLSGTFRWNE